MRDSKEKNKIDYKWAKENCTRINLKILNKTGLVEMIDSARELSGQSRNAWVIQAITERLKRDGLWVEPEKEE